MKHPFRYRAELLGWHLAQRLVWSLSHRRARGLGRRLGALAYVVDHRRRRLALDNIALALPELPLAERRRLARASFEQFGASACEVVSSERLGPEGVAARFDVAGWEHLDGLGGRGLILMTAHFGPAEMAAVPVAQRLGEVHLVFRPPNNPLVATEFESVRARFGNPMISKRGAARRMLGVLRRGGRVGIQIDQRVRPEQGILVPFFGQPVWTSPVVAYLSLLTRAPVVPMFCYPAEGGRYRLRIDPPIEPDAPGPDREAEAALTTRYLAAVEAEVRRAPELWMWMHRRWER